MADTKKNKKIRSAELLPKFFQTDSNKKFLHATIEQLIQPGTVKKINGFVGRQNSRSTTANDIFINEPTKNRQDYQLEPGFVVKDSLDNVTFFKDYADYINQIGVFEGITNNHQRLNEQDFYSWDPHISWDKFVNFQNYYWLPYGPDVINVSGQQEEIISTYEVTIESQGDSNAYIFSPKGSVGLIRNPAIKLYKGQTYKFEISSEDNPFSIKTARTAGSFNRYDIPGIDNVAVTSGTITFTVPYNAPDILYYVSESDVDLGGVFEILSIDENTNINVEEEILGKKTYTLANGIELSNGMKIRFVGNVTPAEYEVGFYYVEGVGDSIKLIDERILELVSQYSESQTILFDNTTFDSMPFEDATAFAGTPDYVVINRSSDDHNPWSRYNRWFHKDVIETSAAANGKVSSLNQNFRAVRPIIEFEPNVRLFNFGTKAIVDVDVIDNYTLDVFSTVEGQLGYNVDNIQLAQDQLVLFTADTDILVKNNIYRVKFITVQDPVLNKPSRQLHFILEKTPSKDDVVLIKQGVINQGLMYWFDGETWILAQQKTALNQSPLFDIVDENKISYGDTSVYEGSTFTGTKIFSYKVGTGVADTNLGFPLSYKNIENVGDILFDFNLATDTYQYKDVADIITKSVNNGFLIKTTNSITSYINGWQLSSVVNVQPGVRIYKNSNQNNNFEIDLFDDKSKLDDLVVKVYINGIRLEQIDPNSQILNWELQDGTVSKVLVLKNDISLDDVLTIKTYSSQPINDNGYYEIPINLQNNPLNELLNDFTLGEVIDHVDSIVENTPNFVGVNPGSNNLRDLGNVTKYGAKFVQHSGPLSLAMYHITSENNNVIRAIEKARAEYNKFKRNFITIAENLGVDADPIKHVDLVLQQINKDKPTSAPYYFSDMVPYGASTRNDYTVLDYRVKSYPLTNRFSLEELSNNAVLVYHTDANNDTQQLVHGRDYTFDDQGFVVISSSIETDDTITIYEFDNTNGCFIAPTPTKLGLWPSYHPKIFVNTALVTPRTMIQGHDGSLILAYEDYRDDLILELEKRIYNNIKVKYDSSVFDIHDVIPSFNRSLSYSINEVNQILAPSFYKWTGLIDRDFTKPLSFDRSNSLTFNYRDHFDFSNYSSFGYWRGIYRWMFDTDRPNICPWEMLGFSEEPNWWQEVYGPAPYTSDNLVLWNDLAEGLVKEPGKPVVQLEKFIRPFLMDHIPVDETGNIISPIDCGLALGVVTQTVGGDFVFGDVSPVEGAWRTSSYYPFSAMIASMLMYPAKTFGVLLDRSRVVKNLAGQLVYKDTGLRISPNSIVLPSIYSSNEPVYTSGIINYIVDYILSDNLKSYKEYQYDLQNMSANLSYRIGGYTSKEKFRFILESKTPLSSSTVFVPQEDYNIILNSSSPIKKITYSGVIITKFEDGYEVKGYSKTQPYFKSYSWIQPGKKINIGGISESYSIWTPGETYRTGSIVKYNGIYYRTIVTHIALDEIKFDYYERLSELPVIGGRDAFIRKTWNRTEENLIPYGTKYRDIQDVVDFLQGYGEWLKDQGFVFDDFNTTLGVVTNWETSAKEFLFWTTQNWSSGEDKWDEWSPYETVAFGSIVRYNGDYYRAIRTINPTTIFNEDDYIKLDGLSTIGSSVISLSPAAAKIVFSTPLSVVADIRNEFNGYEIFAVDGVPIPPNFINSYREDNLVTYIPEGDTGIYCATFYLIQNEQVVIFNNSTIFNDTIYSPENGYRQERIRVSGYKTSEWDGSFNAAGFIFDQAKIQEWQEWQDYNLGDIVKYKEYYYSAKEFIGGEVSFNSSKWYKLDSKPMPSLLPNWTYKASQFEDFYSLDSDNFDSDQQTIAQHLIGYQKRQYLNNIIKDDVSEYKFYQGMITEKGTQNSLNKLFDVLSNANQESVSFFEEWAIRVGQYGASCAFDSIEFILNESDFKSNPQGFELVNIKDPAKVDFIIRQDINDVYLKPIGYNSNPWEIDTTPKMLLRSPGYVRLSDVKVAITTIDKILDYDPTEFNYGDYIWVGFERQEWNVYRLSNSFLTVTDLSYENEELTITVEGLPTQTVNTYIGMINPYVKGFYRIKSISLNTIVVDASLPNWDKSVIDINSIIIFELTAQRLDSIDDANTIDVLGNGELIWTDDSGNNKWATWQYNSVYTESMLTNISPQTITVDDEPVIVKFGKEVLLNKLGDIAVITNSIGEIITYDRVTSTSPWVNRDAMDPPFISKKVGLIQPTDLDLIGDVLAISKDNRWLAVSTSLANNVCTKYIGEWNILTSYETGDIVFDGLNFYSSLSTIQLTLTSPVTANANDFVYQTSTGAFGYVEEAVTNSTTIVLSFISTDFSFSTSGNLTINDVSVTTAPSAILTITSNIGHNPSTNPGYWRQTYLIPTSTSGTNSTFDAQGAVSIYEKDSNNIFSLVNTVVSPYAESEEKFGCSLAFNGDTLFIGASGNSSNTGKVYQLDYLNRTIASGYYNPIGSSGNIIKLSSTKGILPGMMIRGIGFETLHVVGQVVDSNTLIINRSPDAEPEGNLEFYVSEWGYSSSYKNEDETQNLFGMQPSTISSGALFGYSLSVSESSNTLAVSAIGTSSPGKVFVYKGNGLAYSLYQQPIVGTNVRYGESISLSDYAEYLAISSIDFDGLSFVRGIVQIFKFDTATSVYILHQTLTNKDEDVTDKFGSKIFFMNDYKSLIIYSKNAETYILQTFTDGTTFDNELTRFVEASTNSGRVDVYDIYGKNWIYSESLGSDIDLVDNFGSGISVGANRVLVGATNALDNEIRSGVVFDYGKLKGDYTWTKIHEQGEKINVEKIKRAFLYNKTTNKLITYLDVIDASQGKIPGIADQEIKFKTFYDPAVYSVGNDVVNIDDGNAWGPTQVGSLWWDLTTSKFIESCNTDIVYKNNTWNQLFPGASVDIYEWVESSLLPEDWDLEADTEAGLTEGISGTTLYGQGVYSVVRRYDNVSKTFKNTYYYWVKNKKTTPTIQTRNISASDISELIGNPRGTGYKYVGITGTNSFTIVNVKPLLEDKDVILAIDYWKVDNISQNIHTEWKIINENSTLPSAIEQKWFDSLCGKDLSNRVIPDFSLPPKLRYGIENRPRQSMFVNRYEALKQLIEKVNRVLITRQIAEQRDLSKLETYDNAPSAFTGKYDTVLDTDLELRFSSASIFVKPVLITIPVNGRITSVTILEKGKGYKNAPYVEVVGSGQGAIVRTIIDENTGQVTGVDIINPGQGYDSNTVLVLRNYSVLVLSDSQSLNGWSVYSHDISTKVWSRVLSQSYDTRNYWSYVNWFASGYNISTAFEHIVDTFVELNSLETLIGDLVKIKTTNSGRWMLLRKYANSASIDWTKSYEVVGLENGTIQFSSSIYQYAGSIYGYDGTLYDSSVFDNVASIEIRYILNALRDDILIDDLKAEYLELFFITTRYALHEQFNLDWVFKTSFIKALHNVGELKQKVTYNNDNLSDFESYIAEVKPYRTQVREYISAYSKLDQHDALVTDFDLPSTYENNQLVSLNFPVINETIDINDPIALQYPWKHWIDNVGFEVTELQIVSAGSGYIAEPVVRFEGLSGSGAKARAFISNGKVVRIVLLSSGQGYLKAPTVVLDGGLSDTGIAGRAVAIIGNGVIRSNLVKMKFDRITQTYLLTQLTETESFVGTGTRVQFSLTWAPDIRIGQSSVVIDGIDELRDNYTLAIVKSTSRGYTSYSGTITFDTAPATGSTISVSYIKDWSLLNAADRIQYYYNPESGYLGKDLAQLMTGIDYGGVIVQGMDFDVGSGWDSVPYYNDRWDSFDFNSFSDVIRTVDAGTDTFDLGYIPPQGTEINVYYSKEVAVATVSDGETLIYTFSVFVTYPPKVFVTTVRKADQIATQGQTLITLENTTGIKEGDVVTISPIDGDKVLGYNTIVKTVIDSTTVELDQIVFKTIPVNTDVTFMRELVVPTDCIINQNGTVILTEPVTLGSIITISSSLRPVRIDDPNYNTNDQVNENAVMDTWISDGTSSIVSFDIDNFNAVFPESVQTGDLFILRKSTSDGALLPQEYDYDTALSGGNLVYGTATGLLAEDIIVDGDGFITPTTSPAPEEVVPGQVVDAVAIKIFDRPNNGSAKIKVDNFVADGITTRFEISQRINSERAVLVKVVEGYTDDGLISPTISTIKTFNDDYTIDYRNNLVIFNNPPDADFVVSIFSLGFNGSNILDLDFIVSNGYNDEIITNAPWVENFVSLIYVDGEPISSPDIEIFKTDIEYSDPNRVGIRFLQAVSEGALISYIIANGAEQSFAVTKVERITPTGSTIYNLDFKAGNSLPIESSMIVRVDDTILKGPINNYFTMKNNRLSYTLDSTKFLPYSLVANDIVVFVGQTILEQNKDYVLDLKGITVKINKTIYQQYVGQTLIISVINDAGYTYIPETSTQSPKIQFSQSYNNNEIIEVITSYNHDILDIQRTAITVSSTTTYTPNTVEYFDYLKVKTGQLILDREVVDDSYIWVVKNGTLLTPSIDFKLNGNRTSITLANAPATNDEFVLITFSNNVLTSGIAYMQFKDMLNRVHFKRLSQNKQSTLATELRYTDLTVLVEDAATFDLPNPSRNKPGVIEIRGERIEYFSVTTENITDELGTRTVYALGQLRRGTLGTGTPLIHRKGAIVQDIGPSETLPYSDQNIVEQIISDGTNIVNLSFIPTKTDPVISFGRLGYSLKGSYSSLTSYAVNDAVEYEGYYYINIKGYTYISSQMSDKLPTSTVYWKQYSSISSTYGQTDDIEVFVGGYNITETWSPNTSYNIDTIVVYGSYTYKCIQTHLSSSTFREDYISSDSKWIIFVGNIRLKKTPSIVYDVNRHPESPDGDIELDAEFSVDGESKEIRLTNALTFGTRVTVIKKTGSEWDSALNIQYDDSKIAKFLKATPGVWYTGIDKYDSISTTAGTFDSSSGTFDDTSITFDQG